MHKPKPYRCPVCGAEVADKPMPVLRHQLSHVKRRPYAKERREGERSELPTPSEKPNQG